MEKKVELLSPAGNYEAFLAALNAGADAVYLGGQKFSARAYAENFTAQELCRALHTAHFYGKKIYLTVNTLVKEDELSGLYDYIAPFYEAGLDGIIVQDLGVLQLVNEKFPSLAVHASTQMNITGVLGASFLKERGVSRIVPARELSLAEMIGLKQKTGLEIECFIHGAMCYSYSGECLFSSILGGRSGNRGKCAQPCRLMYSVLLGEKTLIKEKYPLSLKDMCTIWYLPKLLDAKVDSLKIEGRMKKPEYTAGVTAIYRKYIDFYYQNGADGFQVEKHDVDYLSQLYIRSEIQTGYYERHNGREMISLHSPGYAGGNEALLSKIRGHYLHEPDRQAVSMKAQFATGKPFRIELSGNGISIAADGETVCQAKKAPLQREELQRQLTKTGNSHLAVEQLEIAMDENGFLPMSAVNALRREAVRRYEDKVVLNHGLTDKRTLPKEEAGLPNVVWNGEKPEEKQAKTISNDSPKNTDRKITKSGSCPATDCVVSTLGQLLAVAAFSCRRIYIDSDLYAAQTEKVEEIIRQIKETEIYLALPYVIRAQDAAYLEKLGSFQFVKGFLARNMEGVSYVCNLAKRRDGQYRLVPDAGLYCFNGRAVSFFREAEEFTLPYESNAKECRQLVKQANLLHKQATLIVYGRIPMMVSANCLLKTSGTCRREKETDGRIWLKDRYQASFPAVANCTHCYNVIYNSVPYSLHLKEKERTAIGAAVERFDFTVEDKEQTAAILSGGKFPFAEYTTGHLKRGVD